MKRLLSAAVATTVAAGSFAHAASISFEDFSYTGTVTVYDSEAAAQSGSGGTTYTIQTATNGTNSTLTDARDGTIYIDEETNFFSFMTGWYWTPAENSGEGAGFGNPNNSNNGFIQLYDADGSSLNSLSIGWNTDNTVFSVAATGENAIREEEYSRLWNAPSAGGPASETGGDFLSYSLTFEATYGSSQPVTSTASPLDVTGGFQGIFQNATDGLFYVVDLAFQEGSLASSQGYTYEGLPFSEVGETFVGGDVPIPGAALLFAPVAAAFGLRRRRAKA